MNAVALDTRSAVVGLLAALGAVAVVTLVARGPGLRPNGAPRRLRRNGKRSSKEERAIAAEENRLGATALQERFNAGEFDGTARSYQDAEEELTRLYDLARENVRLSSAKRAAPRNYRSLTWSEKGESAFLHGKDGVPLASICPSGAFTWMLDRGPFGLNPV